MIHNSAYLPLIEILEQEKESYEKLLKALYKKQKSVIKGKVSELRNLIMEEKSIAKVCHNLANERMDYLNGYCAENNIKAVDIPLKDFIGFSKGPEKEKLENLRYELKNILIEIKKVTRQNETLLHFSINHVRRMTQIFLRATSEEMDMYSYEGKTYNKEVNQKFVNRQV